jgi:hypothetical protein
MIKAAAAAAAIRLYFMNMLLPCAPGLFKPVLGFDHGKHVYDLSKPLASIPLDETPGAGAILQPIAHSTVDRC